MFPDNLTFSIAGWVNDGVDALVSNYGDVFRHISDTLLWAIVNLENLLRLTPWWLMLAIVGVIASMIGARGLGEDVLVGIQTLNVGKGLEAGLAIVILAVVIDRITQAYGRPRHGDQK